MRLQTRKVVLLQNSGQATTILQLNHSSVTRSGPDGTGRALHLVLANAVVTLVLGHAVVVGLLLPRGGVSGWHKSH